MTSEENIFLARYESVMSIQSNVVPVFFHDSYGSWVHRETFQ